MRHIYWILGCQSSLIACAFSLFAVGFTALVAAFHLVGTLVVLREAGSAIATILQVGVLEELNILLGGEDALDLSQTILTVVNLSLLLALATSFVLLAKFGELSLLLISESQTFKRIEARFAGACTEIADGGVAGDIAGLTTILVGSTLRSDIDVIYLCTCGTCA